MLVFHAPFVFSESCANVPTASYDEMRSTEDSFYSSGLVAIMCQSFLCAFEYSSFE